MYKKLVSFCVIFSLLFTLLISVNASSTQVKNTDKAEKLKSIGLFKGSTTGFELDQKPTRAQGAVMLVRLLGKESQAISEMNVHPFSDVPNWASASVGYLYKNNLAKGISGTQFGSDDFMTALQYTTFVLRALGYNDSKGDFKYETCIDLAKEIVLLNDSEAAEISAKPNFLRDDIALISYKALKVKIKDSNKSLIGKLVDSKAVSQEAAKQFEADSAESQSSIILNNSSNQDILNYNNFSFANLYNDYVYFINYSNGGNGYHFVKMKQDGTSKTRLDGIATNKGFFIRGNYIYTLTICGKDIYKISKFTLDGQLIKTFDDIVHEFYVDDNFVYFIKLPDPNNPDPSYSGQLFRMRTDGSEKQMLADVNTTNFAVIGNSIYFDGDGTITKSEFDKFPNLSKDNYFLSELEKSGSLRVHGAYKLDLSTNTKSLLYPTFTIGFQEYNGYVYFLSMPGSSGSVNTLFKVKTDGTSFEQLCKLNKNNGDDFFIVDNKVFYKVNAAQGQPNFFSMNLDGSNNKAVVSTPFQYINIVGDYFYFFDNATQLSRINYRSSGSLETLTENGWTK